MPPRRDDSSDSSDSDKDQKPKLPSRDRDYTSSQQSGAGAIESDGSDDEARTLRTKESSEDEAPQRRKVPPLKPHKTTIGQRMRGVIGSVFAKRTKAKNRPRSSWRPGRVKGETRTHREVKMWETTPMRVSTPME